MASAGGALRRGGRARGGARVGSKVSAHSLGAAAATSFPVQPGGWRLLCGNPRLRTLPQRPPRWLPAAAAPPSWAVGCAPAPASPARLRALLRALCSGPASRRHGLRHHHGAEIVSAGGCVAGARGGVAVAMCA